MRPCPYSMEPSKITSLAAQWIRAALYIVKYWRIMIKHDRTLGQLFSHIRWNKPYNFNNHMIGLNTCIIQKFNNGNCATNTSTIYKPVIGITRKQKFDLMT